MAHLGDDVAAFVDGQLSESATRTALSHLADCDDCAKAVRQQRLLKSRMSTVASPAPPAALLASLAGLAASPPPTVRWWSRVSRSLPFRAGIVLVGASVAVIVTAYAMGGGDHRVGDEVSPPFERYAADFFGPTAVEGGNAITEATINKLDGAGWPCRATLAGDLHRTSAAYADNQEIIALSYSNGTSKLNLFEQNGRLNTDGLAGFASTRISGSQVWVRRGMPILITWDDNGTVYTIVTDADDERIADAIADLPTTAYEDGVAERVGEGLNRMTTWVNAA